MLLKTTFTSSLVLSVFMGAPVSAMMGDQTLTENEIASSTAISQQPPRSADDVATAGASSAISSLESPAMGALARLDALIDAGIVEQPGQGGRQPLSREDEEQAMTAVFTDSFFGETPNETRMLIEKGRKAANGDEAAKVALGELIDDLEQQALTRQKNKERQAREEADNLAATSATAPAPAPEPEPATQSRGFFAWFKSLFTSRPPAMAALTPPAPTPALAPVEIGEEVTRDVVVAASPPPSTAAAAAPSDDAVVQSSIEVVVDVSVPAPIPAPAPIAAREGEEAPVSADTGAVGKAEGTVGISTDAVPSAAAGMPAPESETPRDLSALPAEAPPADMPSVDVSPVQTSAQSAPAAESVPTLSVNGEAQGATPSTEEWRLFSPSSWFSKAEEIKT